VKRGVVIDRVNRQAGTLTRPPLTQWGPAEVGHNDEESNMSDKSFKREFAEEVFCKAMVSAAPIAAGIIMGPVGIVVGIVAAVAIAVPGYNGGRSESKENASR
jgi:hypothetical protein